VCPGYTNTDIIQQASKPSPKRRALRGSGLTHFTDSNPMGRLIEPAEVAAAVQWLCKRSGQLLMGRRSPSTVEKRLNEEVLCMKTTLADYQATHFLWEPPMALR
jgi:NAD(P)-dependent dehydrogenase (short-subunit alcohol dehydrogenase family)